MIKRIFDNSPLKHFCNCPLSVRAVSLWGTYGSGCEQVKLWVQEKESKCTALIVDFYADATLITLADADFEELGCFLDFSDYESITLSPSDAERLCINCDEYNLMSCLREKINTAEYTANDIIFLDSRADMKLYRDIYLFEDMTVPFEAWYADMALKVAKGYACGAVLYRESLIVSAAVVPNMCDIGAIISGVKTEEGQQGRGYASECIKSLQYYLKNDLYIFCSDSLVPFYKKLGFEFSEKISITKEQYHA